MQCQHQIQSRRKGSDQPRNITSVMFFLMKEAEGMNFYLKVKTIQRAKKIIMRNTQQDNRQKPDLKNKWKDLKNNWDLLWQEEKGSSSRKEKKGSSSRKEKNKQRWKLWKIRKKIKRTIKKTDSTLPSIMEL